MRRLYSRLIRIFTFCLIYFIPIIKIFNKQGRCPNFPDRPNLPYFTLERRITENETKLVVKDRIEPQASQTILLPVLTNG